MESIIHLPMPGQLKIVSVRMAPAISTPICRPMVVTTGIIALRSAWTPITRRDYPVVQSGLLLIAGMVMVVNLLVDLTYGLINPRIRAS